MQPPPPHPLTASGRKRSLCEISSTSDAERVLTSKPSGSAAEASTNTTTADANIRPMDFLLNLLRSQPGFADLKVHACQSVPNDFFVGYSEAEMDAYGSQLLGAIRSRDVVELRRLHKAGQPLKCSNRFGESLLHLACRKGFCDVVALLVHEADVPLRVKDDFGRNPAHDACWTVTPNFQLMDLIVEICPDLFFVQDVRGHTPLDYVRREHWSVWNRYLKETGTKLAPRLLRSTTSTMDIITNGGKTIMGCCYSI